MNENFKQLAPELVDKVRKEAWSIENMEAHKADQRKLTYIGSEIKGYVDNDRNNGRLLYDYYIDGQGAYWYESRVLLSDGQIVSIDVCIFGRRIKTGRRTNTRRNK